MTTTQSPCKSEFYQKFRALNWSWVRSHKALESYARQLYLIWKYRIQITPDRLADSVLHEHLNQPSFNDDMMALLDNTVIHQPGETKNAAWTRDLYEREFGPVSHWEPADCAINLAGA